MKILSVLSVLTILSFPAFSFSADTKRISAPARITTVTVYPLLPG